MKKLTGHVYILWAICLAVTALLAFVIPFERNVVYWLALGCTALVFCLALLAFYRAFRRDETLQSKLLGWPILRAVLLALAVQWVVGFVLMALARVCPVTVAVVAEALVLAGSAAILTVRDAAREAVTAAEAAPVDRTAAMKTLRGRAAALAAGRGIKALRELSDALRYADPTTSDATAPYDQRLDELLTRLESETDADTIDTLAAEARRVLSQRAAAAKAGK